MLMVRGSPVIIPDHGNSLKTSNLKWLWLVLFVVILDQSTKYAASHWLEYNNALPVFPGFHLTLVHNTGAAFSFLRDAGGWQIYFFIILTTGVTIALLVWMIRLPTNRVWLAFALAFIMGGALGNLLDRIRFGYVVDFIEVYYDKWSWPVFNVADSAITIGAVMMIIDALWFDQAEVTTHSGKSDESP